MATKPKRNANQPPDAKPHDFQGIQSVQFEIRGVTALLQHRFAEQSELPAKTRQVHTRTQDPRTIAENHCYRTPEGELYHPGAAFMRLFREAGSAHKERGSRKSLKYIIPACVLVPDDIVMVLDKNNKPQTNFEVDARPVVIPSTKGRIMCYRPRQNSWKMIVNIEIDTSMIDLETVHQLLTEGGRRLGIGDYRPEKGGPFGRFQLERWEVIT